MSLSISMSNSLVRRRPPPQTELTIFIIDFPSSSTGILLLFLLTNFALIHLTMVGQQRSPSQSASTIPSMLLLHAKDANLSSFPKWNTMPGSEDDDVQHSEVHNTFESTRYGLRIDHCPNGGEPELSEQDGRIKLCQLDAECRPSYKCENIVGLMHFGKQMRYCCPTKTSVCTLKPKLDMESALSSRCHRPLLRTFYYFDVERLRCVKSRMAQCEEFGENRFASELECRTKCETTACELGESILLHNNSFDTPFTCAADDDCPVGYNCRMDRIFRRSVCCGFLNFEPCPLGFRSFTVPFNGRAKTCRNSAVRDECPTDYVCTQNAITREQFCCTVEKGVCPEGHQAYIHPLTDGTIKCNLRSYDATTSCPPGYVCLAAVFGSSWGFCCAQAMIVLASCPEDSFPQINPITNQPQRCELTQQPSVCAHGFECETDVANHLGFCCSIMKHEKVKPSPEPTPRKRTRPPTLMTTTTTTLQTTTSSTTTTTMMTTTMTTKVLELTSRRASSTTTTAGTGIKKKKGRWKGKNMTMKSGGSEEGSSPSSSSSSSEQTEKADLLELSTKLDRFISGVRRRIQLPRGHLKPTRIWRLKKGRNKWGLEEIRRIFGKRGRGNRGEERKKMMKKTKVDEEDEEDDERKKKKKRVDEEDEEEESLKGGRRREKGRRKSMVKDEADEEEEEEVIGGGSALKCPHGFRPLAYPGTKRTYLECMRRKEEKKRKRKKQQQATVSEEDEPELDEDEDEDEHLRHQASICPDGAICLPARDDPHGRALCCVENNKTMEEEEGEEEDEDEEKEEDEEDGMSEGDSTTSGTTTTTAASTTTTVTTTAATTTTATPLLLVLERSEDPACPRLIAGRVCEPGSTDVCVEDGFFCQYNKERKEFVCCTMLGSGAKSNEK